MEITLILIVVTIFISIIYFFNKNEKEKYDRLTNENEKVDNSLEKEQMYRDHNFLKAFQMIIYFRDLITNSKSSEDEKVNKNEFATIMKKMRSSLNQNSELKRNSFNELDYYEGELSDLKRNSYNALVAYGRGEITEEELEKIFKKEELSINFPTQAFNDIEEYKKQINLFINKMKKMPDWYEIIQARGNGHAMLAKTMNIKVDDYEYWANAHKEEYILKYNDGNLDLEGINLRVEKFGFIVAELEKIINKADELKLNITDEMHNDYCAARASVLGAEYAQKEMTKSTENETKESIENNNGFNRFFFEDGGYQECFKENGILKGDFKVFNKNGVLTLHVENMTMNENQGLVDGKELMYYDDGMLKSKTYFIKGKRDGFGTEYDEDGKIIQIDYYKNDEDISNENDNNKKILLREIKKYLNDGIEVYAVNYLWKCQDLKIDVKAFVNEPEFKI